MNSHKMMTARERDTSIFVGGIGGKVTEREIRDYFESFGQIHSITLIPKKNNRKLNSGYCFISFKESETKWEVLSYSEHFLCGRRINCKTLLKGSELKDERMKNTSKKLCVKFLPEDTSEAAFEEFFSSFGEIHSFYLVNYKHTEAGTTNGFLVYKDDAVFRRLLELKFVKFGQVRLKIERYIKQFEREDPPNMQSTPSLKMAIETGPLCSIKPTQLQYFTQQTNRNFVDEPASNLRFNVLLNPFSGLPKVRRPHNLSLANLNATESIQTGLFGWNLNMKTRNRTSVEDSRFPA